MSFVRSPRGLKSAFFALFLSTFLMSCGAKNNGNTNPKNGPVPNQQVTTPPSASSNAAALVLSGTWETDCVNDAKYTMEFNGDNLTMQWIYTQYIPADSAGGSSCEQIQNVSPEQYEYSIGAVGSISTPANGTPFNFYSPDGTYAEKNVVVYNRQAGTLGLGDWNQSGLAAGQAPTVIGYTFTQISQ